MTIREALVAGACLLATLLVAASAGAKHPRLVSESSTACMNCHDDLFDGQAVRHEPTEDCTNCHEVEISETETTMTLMDEGTALCLVCHDDLEAAAEGDLEVPHAPVTDDCITCHSPHASEQARLLLEPVPAVCLDCHDLDDLKPAHSGQLTAAVDCRSCHLPHGGALQAMLTGETLHPPFEDRTCDACHRKPFGDKIRLRSRGERVCTACHSDILDYPDTGSLHPPVRARRGSEGCVSCHNPHLSANDTLLLRADAELCRSCHAEVVSGALADTGHAAAEDCSNCHQPHGSEQQRLLTVERQELCFECHDSEEIPEIHLGASADRLDCTSCHTPHGEGHPKLMARNLHPALEDGCDTCHDESFDAFTEEDNELCLMCHDDPSEDVAVEHAAVEDGCVNCHNPHATAQAKLVKAPGGQACIECHDDKGAEDGEQLHGIIDEYGCQACHTPHGGDAERLLRVEGDTLCLSCHDQRLREALPREGNVTLYADLELPGEQVVGWPVIRLSADGQQGHPMRSHRALGKPTPEELANTEVNFEGELHCLSCHDPHKGRGGGLQLPPPEPGQAPCARCHTK